MTNRFGILERWVMRSSVMPSLKYSWPGSPLRFVNGSTAIDGLSGKVSAGCKGAGIEADVVGGRKDRCCTKTTTKPMIATVPTEIPARRRFLFRRGFRAVGVVV